VTDELGERGGAGWWVSLAAASDLGHASGHAPETRLSRAMFLGAGRRESATKCRCSEEKWSIAHDKQPAGPWSAQRSAREGLSQEREIQQSGARCKVPAQSKQGKGFCDVRVAHLAACGPSSRVPSLLGAAQTNARPHRRGFSQSLTATGPIGRVTPPAETRCLLELAAPRKQDHTSELESWYVFF